MKVYAFFVKSGYGTIQEDAIDWMISKITKSDYVHCGLLFESENDSYMVHVTRSGIFMHPEEEYPYPYDLFEFRNHDESKVDKIHSLVAKKISRGNEYDYLQILKIWLKCALNVCIPDFISIREAFICSTLVVEAAKAFGYSFRMQEELYAPGDLARLGDLLVRKENHNN